MAPDQIRMFPTKIIAKAKIILINWNHFELRNIIINLEKSMILRHGLKNILNFETSLLTWKINDFKS